MKSILYIILLFIAVFPNAAQSQDYIRANPADVNDAQSLFINPAVVPFQNLCLNLGMKIYHVGFIANNSSALKHSYNSNSIPNFAFNNIGLGILMESFYTPYFYTVGIGTAVAYPLSNIISFGISAKALNINYRVDANNVFDPNDPLFNDLNNWNVSFGTGFLVRPDRNFMFGISCNNINRPDLSLVNKGARQPIVFDFGLKYYYSIFGASLFGNYQQDNLTISALAEVKLYNQGLLKTGYHDRSFMLEGQLDLSSNLSLHYRLEYPLNELNHYSHGSHQLGFSWNLRQNEGYSYDIQASVDTVQVVRQRSVLQIDKILTDDIDRLFSYLDDADLGIPGNGAAPKLMTKLVNDPELSLDEEMYRLYRTKLTDLLLTNKNIYNEKNTINIYCRDNLTAQRAIRIKNFLITELGINEDYIKIYNDPNRAKVDSLQRKERINNLKNEIDNHFHDDDQKDYVELAQPWVEMLEPKIISFHIGNIVKKKVYQWKVEIKSIAGEVVHTIIGYHEIPDLITWDGFTADSKLLEVGNYYYSLQYSQGDRWYPREPKQRRLIFINITRDRIVRFTPTTPIQPENVEIILK